MDDDGTSEATSETRRRHYGSQDNDIATAGESATSEESLNSRSKLHVRGYERSLDEYFWLAIGISLVMFYILVHLVATSCTGFSILPKHTFRSKASMNSQSFQCHFAQDNLLKLTSFGPRVVGSKENEILTPKFLISELNKISSLAPRLRKQVVDLDHYQVDQGTFTLNLMNNGDFASVYRNIGSVVYRIRGRKWLHGNSTKSDALLVNCHYDTVVLSPGAGDNAVSCAVQMEVARAILAGMGKMGEGLPEHDIIFLFNGAEENMLQASHAFITKHHWARDVRAFVNLDSAGSGGREIVFQTGPHHPWLIWEYARYAPYPFATVLGQDLFQAGLIPSDTDFRIFRDYGKIPGVDVAYISNGYVYHTVFDTADRISMECIQRAGDNLLALVRGLASSKYFINHDEIAHDSSVFFDVLGFFMIVYPLRIGTFLNCFTVVMVFAFLFVRYVVKLRKVSILLVAALSICGCIFFVFVVLLSIATFVTYVLRKPLSWYALNFNIIGLYVFPSSSAFFLYWYLYSKFLSTHISELPPKYSLFDVFFDAVLMVVSTILLLASFLKRGSVFLICMWLLIPFLGRGCFQLFLYTRRSFGYLARRYHFLLFLLALGFPTIQMYYNLYTLFEVFVPILGRSMSVAVPDIFLCALVLVALYFPFLFLSSWARCSRPKTLRRIGKLFFHCTVAWLILVALSKYGRSYSEDDVMPRKQRSILVHMNRDLRDDPKRPELVTRHDSGIWILSLDYNPVIIDSNNSSTTSHCDGHEPYCGYPFLYPVAGSVRESSYIPGPAHRLTPVPRLQVSSRTPIGNSAVNMTFLVSGPSHTHIYISVSDDVDMVSYSLGDEGSTGARPKRQKIPPPVKGKHYFIYYSYGGAKLPSKPLSFWAVFEGVNKPIGKERSSRFYVALGGQYLYGEGTHSRELKEFLKRTGDYQTSLHWTSTYSMWTFDLKSEVAPSLNA